MRLRFRQEVCPVKPVKLVELANYLRSIHVKNNLLGERVWKLLAFVSKAQN